MADNTGMNRFGADVFGQNVASDPTYGESVTGVQMDAPMPGAPAYEDGFNPTGEDMSGLAAPAAYPTGVELPGVPIGVHQADIMVGMAQPEQFHDGNDIVGVLSDDASFVGDVAASAGLHIVSSFDEMWSGTIPGRENTGMADPEDGQGTRGLLVGQVSNQGYPMHADNQGIDSMQGLDFAGFPAPSGEQDNFSTINQQGA